MNAPAHITSIAIPTVPGTPFAGGFYAGRFRIGDEEFALIVAPKAEGEHDDIAWGQRGQDIPGAHSFNDGLANTQAMADAGSELAQWALGLNIAGHADWYLPSRDELEICYRNLKPTTETNWVYRNGDNPSSVPTGYPYTKELPAQTAADAFQAGGDEAFEDIWHWSSTQYSALSAWGQYFGDGLQDGSGKFYEFRARAVRRFISPSVI